MADVEHLALGHALDDVEQDDVGELLLRDDLRLHAADLTGPDQRDLCSGHGATPCSR